uniref:Chemokine ligand 34b n=1 Tax=Ctenopharyngodon idella TaxID=7959 RepID=A0A345D754_CTEID|nr:chemokine ligand 34b [Ctenopharyngodon idella]
MVKITWPRIMSHGINMSRKQGRTDAQQKVSTCCTEVSRAELTDPIISFRMQKQSPPCVKAVIFQTERGEFCIDWTQPWVQKKVKQFLTQRNKHPSSTP